MPVDPSASFSGSVGPHGHPIFGSLVVLDWIDRARKLLAAWARQQTTADETHGAAASLQDELNEGCYYVEGFDSTCDSDLPPSNESKL